MEGWWSLGGIAAVVVVATAAAVLVRQRAIVSSRPAKLNIPARVTQRSAAVGRGDRRGHNSSSSSNSSTCVVTGASGFVGKALVARLLETGPFASIVAFDLAKPEFDDGRVRNVQGSVLDPAALAEAFRGADAVFHLAGLISVFSSARRTNQLFNVNVVGTENVINSCIGEGVARLVFISSTSAVFTIDNERPFATAAAASSSGDADPFADLPLGRHISSYGATKYQAEKAVRDANGIAGLKTICLRPNVIYGPGDPFVTKTLVVDGAPIMRAGNARQGIIYVGNLAEWLIAADRALQNPAVSPKVCGRAFFAADENLRIEEHWRRLYALNRPNAPMRTVPVWLCRVLAVMFDLVDWLLDGTISRLPYLSRAAVVYAVSDIPFEVDATKRLFQLEPVVTVDESYEIIRKYYHCPPPPTSSGSGGGGR